MHVITTLHSHLRMRVTDADSKEDAARGSLRPAQAGNDANYLHSKRLPWTVVSTLHVRTIRFIIVAILARMPQYAPVGRPCEQHDDFTAFERCGHMESSRRGGDLIWLLRSQEPLGPATMIVLARVSAV
mmetsp:Transcript_2839/g.8676  ORF Transcript_2839/g.8676 Transcript_2839/m.8676 type:complete len:129 (+) Transcript_2839:344-730(+)